ncbi:dynein regulatory complex subunit 5 isoform X2 [Cherax quadricarinatus]|uniref:dynein regulatory complex subunit 5 isoform X2 n=1 Tax=Cherax quadricarinatus TaxID=27406 RepID=UPI00387E7DF1
MMVQELRALCLRVITINVDGRQKGLRQRVVRERAVTPQIPVESLGSGNVDVEAGGGSAGSGEKQQSSARVTSTESTKHVHTLPSITAVRQESSWQRGYLETHLARAVSTTQDTKRGWRTLSQLLQLCAPYVQTLAIPSLAPASHSGELAGLEQGSLDHLNLADVISALPSLKVVSVRYQTVEEDSDLRWVDLGISVPEAASLAHAVTSAPGITHLRVYESCVDDIRAEVLLVGLQTHKGITCLDLHHNLLTCASVPRLVTLLTSTHLITLHLQHNSIGEAGGRQLGAALAQTPHLEALLLDLNPLGVAGGAVLEGAAQGAGKLKVLSMAGCRLTDVCWPHLTAALTSLPNLRYVSLAANPFTQEPPAEVVEAAEGGPRVLLTNLDGTTYLLGQVRVARFLPPALRELQDHLEGPLTLAATQDDLAHYLSLHGLRLQPQDFTIEEELRGMCLFNKDPKNILY